MPSSFMGFGTTFYGKRDFLPDGSYITTEWIVAAMIPVFPNQSLRVKDRGISPQSTPLVHEVYSYDLCDAVPMNAKQVGCVYGFTLLLFAWYASFFWFLAHTQWEPSGWIILLPLCAPFLLPWLLRRRAKSLPIGPVHFGRVSARCAADIGRWFFTTPLKEQIQIFGVLFTMAGIIGAFVAFMILLRSC